MLVLVNYTMRIDNIFKNPKTRLTEKVLSL